MKKIIKNKVYDTRTALLVGTKSAAGLENDREFYRESLYRKKTGEYFLHGKGGEESPYRTGNPLTGWTPGETIKPLESYDAARTWAELNLTAEEYKTEFESELGISENIFIRVSPACKTKLKALQADCGESYSAIIEKLIENKK